MVKNVLNTLRKKQKNNKGFSLVELIVVIAIMAVLVGVLAPQFIKYVERSRQSTDLQNVEELKNAVEVEAADNGITADATITIKSGKATIGGMGSKVPESLSKTEVSLKSSGWKEQVYTYSATDLKWKLTSGTTVNDKGPKKDMADVFSMTSSEEEAD